MSTINLTHLNYFTGNNRALTNSKIKDYLLSPHFFFKKHIECTIPKEFKQAYVIGSAVDDLLTQITNKSKYFVMDCDFRSKKNREEKADMEAQGYVVMKGSQYDEVMDLAISVENTSAWKDIVKRPAGFQNIIFYEMPLGSHFDAIAGIPDHFYIEDGVCYITDLKTSQTINERKYYYHCIDYGYFRAAAMYQKILKKLHPEITSFVFRHIVVEKIPYVNNVAVFILSQDKIEEETHYLEMNIDLIANDKEFKKRDAKWSEAIELGAINSNW